MAHWLEERENERDAGKSNKARSASFKDRKFRISQNYARNKEAYEGFLSRLSALIDRVNQLPADHRKDFGKISVQRKESQLDHHLLYFSTSRRFQEWGFRGILRPLVRVHYKHVRIIYFFISTQMNKTDVEIRDEYLVKHRYDGKVIHAGDPQSRHHRSRKGRERFHKVYAYDISLLDEELAMTIIDWLAFKAPVTNLPVLQLGEERGAKNE
jgi:hypothetical protein